MKISAKLAIAFASLAALVLLVGGLSVYALSDTTHRFSDYVKGTGAMGALANATRTGVDQRAIAARNLVLVTEPADMAAEKATVLHAHEQVTTSLAKLKALIGSLPNTPPQARSLVAEIEKIEAAYAPVALGIVDLALKGQKDEAITRMNRDCRPLLAALVKATDSFAAMTAEHGNALLQDAETADCPRRSKSDPPCRSNSDPGMGADRATASCG
jgi:methyl-accepting chemotaxis protein-1 (serine sensor receptor)